MFEQRMTSTAFAVLVAWFGFFSPAILCAQTFDPTKPPIFNGKPVPAVKLPRFNPRDYQVTSILLSEQRKVAVINNQVVTVGDAVTAGESGKAKVVKISTSEITLRKGRREFVVRLPSTQYMKSAVSGLTDQTEDQPKDQPKDQP